MLSLYVVIHACVSTACTVFNLPVDMSARGLLSESAFELQCNMLSWTTAQDWLTANHPEMTMKEWRCEYQDPAVVSADL